MALITDYASLQTTVTDWLNRSDLTSAVQNFIQNAEQGFRRDRRLRKLQDAGAISISTDNHAMPSDFHSVESWYLDGSTYFVEFETVSSGQLADLKLEHGATGVPVFVAFVDGVASFAPAPNDTFTSQLVYWRKITALSDSNTTNWLLTSHPDIYLYAALVESAPYLKDDQRLQVWRSELERRIEQLHLATDQEQFSGTMTRQIRAIG